MAVDVAARVAALLVFVRTRVMVTPGNFVGSTVNDCLIMTVAVGVLRFFIRVDVNG